MSEDNGFVDRPTNIRGTHRIDNSTTGRLRETAANGKAVLVKRGAASRYSSHLKTQGYRVHQSRIGAPDGMVYVWTEKIEAPGGP